MKLKLTTKPQAAPDGAPAASPANEAPIPTPSSAAPKLKFKLAAPSSSPADGPAAEPPKQKRKYTKKPKVDADGNATITVPKIKKRAREDNGDEVSPVAKRKPKPTAKSLALVHSDEDNEDELAAPTAVSAAPRAAPVRTGSLLKIRMKGAQGGVQKAGPAVIKVKGIHGKPPVRPPGVGYDSEAEEAEEDPAIESQFVLRMQPGPDCDTLRKAIEEKKLGKSSAEGGTNVLFRFFDREGRRATVTIHGRMYAATMVDLPCVIESMKSWNKKDWIKTADVCQMLLVLGRVQNEEEAKKFPMPPEVDPFKHQYAHGLTPPMHHVRRRRFRPRQSYHEIEQKETEVNKLLEADRRAAASGGKIEFAIIDDKVDSEDETSEEDAEGEDDIADTTEYVIEGETPGGEVVEVDAEDDPDLAAALAAGLMEDDDDNMNDLFGDNTVEVETPATAHDVAMHAIGEGTIPTTETAASTPNAPTSPDDDDEDDDNDADTPEGAVIDAEETAAQEGREQNMVEIRELEQSIADAWKQYHQINNQLFRTRTKAKIDRLQNDLDVKKKALGIDEDGDEE